MRVKLFVEPQGKAREQIQLESLVPLDFILFEKWMTSWIPSKDFKKWSKQDWDAKELGELRPGKIFEASVIDSSGEKSLKGNLVAYRSYIPDSTGAKKKLPMVLVVQLKKTLDYDYFIDEIKLDSEQDKYVKDALKQDVWAPISIYQPQSVDRKYVVDVSEVLPQAIQYLEALYGRNPESVGLPTFIETEILKS